MPFRTASLGVPCLGLALALVACGDGLTSPGVPPVAPDLTVVTLSDIPDEVYGRLTGGGHIRAGDWDLSFAGVVQGVAGDRFYVEWADADRWITYEPRGEWVVQLHRVPHPELTGRTFKATRFLEARYTLKREPLPACVSRANFTVEGTLDGEPGWVAWLVMADAGHQTGGAGFDSFRMALWPPGTHPEGALIAMDTWNDFAPDATCLGGRKRNLASGNLRVFIGY